MQLPPIEGGKERRDERQTAKAQAHQKEGKVVVAHNAEGVVGYSANGSRVSDIRSKDFRDTKQEGDSGEGDQIGKKHVVRKTTPRGDVGNASAAQ